MHAFYISDVMDIVKRVVEKHEVALAKAQKLGTLDAVDRSRQYQETDSRELLRAVNEAWSKIRTCERELGKKDAAIADLKSRLRIVNLKFWLCSIAVLVEAGTIGFLAKELFSRIH
jgi:hypothetical protein